MHGDTYRICVKRELTHKRCSCDESSVLQHFIRICPQSRVLSRAAPPKQVTPRNRPISAPFRVTSAVEILSHMNRLSDSGVRGFLAVEIQARHHPDLLIRSQVSAPQHSNNSNK